MRGTSALLAALLPCALAPAQVIQVPNPSFEQGREDPAHWTLRRSGEGQSGAWERAGAERFIALRGDGKGESSWLSEPLPLAPNALYRLTFLARAAGSGGTPVSGPLFCNRDLGAIPARWTRFESIFRTPAELSPQSARLRFGQWHLVGQAAFDDIALERIQALDESGALALGAGERLEGCRYLFEAPLRSAARNHARALVRYQARFNTDRWVLSAGDEVLYSHSLRPRELLSARLEVNVNWHRGGELLLEASGDGSSWQRLGAIGRSGALAAQVPPALLPAEQLWVRLSARAGGGSEVALQVDRYQLEARCSGEPLELRGRTRYLHAIRRARGVRVSILGLGEGLPGGRNAIRARLERASAGDAPRRILLVRPWWQLERQGARSGPRHELAPLRLAAEPLALEVPYEVGEPGRWTLRFGLRCDGDERDAFEARTSLTVPRFYDRSYGRRLDASSDDLGLWWACAGRKIPRRRPAPAGPPDGAVPLALARGEVEAVQVVLAPRAPLRALRVAARALHGPGGARIDAQAIEILRVRYVQITHPSDASGLAAWWPDPLPPLEGPLDLAGGRNQPLWIRVRAPRDTPAGLYRGELHLSAAGLEARIPLAVQVFDFELPRRMTLASAFGFSPANVWRYHGAKSEAHKRALLAGYFASFSSHHIAPYDPAPLDPLRVSWKVGPRGPQPRIDFSAWDRALHRAIEEYHFRTFRLPPVGMGGGSFHSRRPPEIAGFGEGTPEYRRAFASYWGKVQEHLRARGWLDEAFVYWFDEPAPRDYDFVRAGFERLEAAAPAVRRMLTEQVEDQLLGGPNLWCPLSSSYDHERAEERRALGEHFWWYICTGPRAPYATLFIDHPGTELRVWAWQSWKRRIEGLLIWQSNYWTSSAAYPDPEHPQNPWKDPMSWTSGYSTPKGVKRPWGNGDGRFLYPPERCADGRPGAPVLAGPVDSLRWEMLRDGIEDYEYLAILERRLAARGAALDPAARRRLAALLEVPAQLSSSRTQFTTNPAVILARRLEVARAIEELGR